MIRKKRLLLFCDLGLKFANALLTKGEDQQGKYILVMGSGYYG